MKSHLFFFTFIICNVSIFSEQDGRSNQQPQQIHITFNANTDAGVNQKNNMDQKAEHESHPTTLVDTNINNQPKNNRPLQEQRELEPTVSQTNYVIRNGIKLLGVYLMASRMANMPFLFPAYLVNRFVIYPCISDTPWLDKTTPEEAEQLTAQGKYKIPEPIIYPIAHHLHKALMKK